MPRPKLPEGLYISVSQVKAFLKCPAFYGFKYVLGETPAFLPVNLAFGSAVHSALAAYYLELKATGIGLRRDLLLDTFRSAWTEASSGPLPLQGAEDDEAPGLLTDKGVSMLQVFHEVVEGAAPVTVKDVECGFAVPLRDPGSGEVLEEQLVGTMDLVIQEDRIPVVVEHKTSAKKYGADQLRWDVQPTAYKLGALASGWGNVKLRYQVLTKTKAPALQVADVDRDGHDHVDFLKMVVGVLRSVEAGVDYPVRGWACRTCPYAVCCR